MDIDDFAKRGVNAQNAVDEATDKAELMGTIVQLKVNIGQLLRQVGDPGTCKGCQAPIFWVTHKRNLKPTPYTPEGLNHFADCPAAARFKRPRNANPGA